MLKPIWILIEKQGDGLAPSVAELASAAKSASGDGPVEGIMLGNELGELPASAGRYGVSKVHVVDHPNLAYDLESSHAAALASVVEKQSPALVLGSAGGFARTLFPYVAALSGLGCAADCTAVSLSDDSATVTRPVYVGNAFASVSVASPALVTVRPKAYAPALESEGAAEVVGHEFETPEPKERFVESVEEGGGAVKLQEADVIVSAGRGVRGPENVQLVKDLADAMGAAFGASRAVVDAGWVPYSHQVGQTGKTVSPKLYVACGISGAIQHLAGMRSSKTIVAVNRDPDAPIFNVATYGVVGDLFKVVPALTAELNSR
jgi:electron transfer flavoprotein alpha subunit